MRQSLGLLRILSNNCSGRKTPTLQDDKQGIGFYAQYGWAPKDRCEIEDYVGGGLRWQGAIPSRDDDVLGLGAFNVYFSDRAGS